VPTKVRHVDAIPQQYPSHGPIQQEVPPLRPIAQRAVGPIGLDYIARFLSRVQDIEPEEKRVVILANLTRPRQGKGRVLPFLVGWRALVGESKIEELCFSRDSLLFLPPASTGIAWTRARFDRNTVHSGRKVQVRPPARAARAHLPDLLTGLHQVPGLDRDTVFLEVPVVGLLAVTMIDDHIVRCSTPGGLLVESAINGSDYSTRQGGNDRHATILLAKAANPVVMGIMTIKSNPRTGPIQESSRREITVKEVVDPDVQIVDPCDWLDDVRGRYLIGSRGHCPPLAGYTANHKGCPLSMSRTSFATGKHDPLCWWRFCWLPCQTHRHKQGH